MAPASKANYKSYEAQARLVRAIVAAHPTTKWNYKDIAKYFGQSTADGIQFQFRSIKKDADKMRAVADSGGDPSACLDLGSASAAGTASTVTPSSTPKTPRSRGVASMPASGASTGGSRTVKRSRSTAAVKVESDDDGDSESTQNWSELEVSTPSKRPRTLDALAAPPPPPPPPPPSSGQKPGGTPSRLAAARASAAFAEQQQSSESEAETGTRARPGSLPMHVRNDAGARPSAAFATAASAAPRARASLFGDVPAFRPQPPSTAGKTAGSEFLTGGSGGLSAENSYFDDYDPYEGEI